eukprot:TRINITY_DN694_c0_g1_i4.p1 TRINITY_DN694_c0_g1~~TRINITY_DN694_c0_g1_i4.p1  ORF type:complete len:140 (-),score=35.61 TRINITY_DN694_c0_g1_i4:56-475(-)
MPGAGGATSSEPKRELEPQPPPSPKRAKIDQEETKPDPSPAEEAAEGETGTVVEEKERPIPVARTRRSQFWYYRDSTNLVQGPFYPGQMSEWFEGGHFAPSHNVAPSFQGCLLYTSDAADEEDSVDLGGRRIIKKKKKR